MGLYRLLSRLNVKPDMLAGHSYGEYVALCAGGVYSEEVLYRISEARGRFMLEEAGHDRGTMSAVEAQPERISEIIHTVENVWMSNLNSPSQTVISGSRDGIRKANEKLHEQGINTRPIAVSCAFHSPMIAPVLCAVLLRWGGGARRVPRPGVEYRRATRFTACAQRARAARRGIARHSALRQSRDPEGQIARRRARHRPPATLVDCP